MYINESIYTYNHILYIKGVLPRRKNVVDWYAFSTQNQ